MSKGWHFNYSSLTFTDLHILRNYNHSLYIIGLNDYRLLNFVHNWWNNHLMLITWPQVNDSGYGKLYYLLLLIQQWQLSMISILLYDHLAIPLIKLAQWYKNCINSVLEQQWYKPVASIHTLDSHTRFGTWTFRSELS